MCLYNGFQTDMDAAVSVFPVPDAARNSSAFTGSAAALRFLTHHADRRTVPAAVQPGLRYIGFGTPEIIGTFIFYIIETVENIVFHILAPGNVRLYPPHRSF